MANKAASASLGSLGLAKGKTGEVIGLPKVTVLIA